MTTKKAYRATAVKNVVVKSLLPKLAQGPVAVGLDVGKETVLVVVRDQEGTFLRPWKVNQPGEIKELVDGLMELRAGRPLVVSMESTGTYGDPLRQALADRGIEVGRVSSKATSDYAEIFDGVPSAHDGKDAAIVAELTSLGKWTAWPYVPPSEAEGSRKNWVEWMDAQQEILQLWLGRLEGLLARHWPEVTRMVKLHSVTLLRALAYYGGPRGLGEDEEAAQRLLRWGGRFLKAAKVESLIAAARDTVGVRMTEADRKRMRRYAQEALKAHREIGRARRELKRLAEGDETVQRVARVVGTTTAGVLCATLGAPGKYHCGGAYRKAMGLNLKERSSGKHQGKLKITKRGPGIARRWLYFAALRMVQQSAVRGWYERKKKKDKDRGKGALVAVMRKLALAIYAVATRDEPFDVKRLFPGKPRTGKRAA